MENFRCTGRSPPRSVRAPIWTRTLRLQRHQPRGTYKNEKQSEPKELICYRYTFLRAGLYALSCSLFSVYFYRVYYTVGANCLLNGCLTDLCSKDVLLSSSSCRIFMRLLHAVITFKKLRTAWCCVRVSIGIMQNKKGRYFMYLCEKSCRENRMTTCRLFLFVTSAVTCFA